MSRNLVFALDCPYCEHRNPVGSRFCNACGSPLHLKPCKACGLVSDVSASACSRCGNAFDPPAAQPQPVERPAVAPRQAEAEPDLTPIRARRDEPEAALPGAFAVSDEEVRSRARPRSGRGGWGAGAAALLALGLLVVPAGLRFVPGAAPDASPAPVQPASRAERQPSASAPVPAPPTHGVPVAADDDPPAPATEEPARQASAQPHTPAPDAGAEQADSAKQRTVAPEGSAKPAPRRAVARDAAPRRAPPVQSRGAPVSPDGPLDPVEERERERRRAQAIVELELQELRREPLVEPPPPPPPQRAQPITERWEFQTLRPKGARG